MKIKFNEIFTISNLLSLLRLLMAIPFWLLFDNYEVNKITIAILCILAAMTDILDGYLARKLNQVTEFGKIIDPLADKICIATIFVKLFLIGKLDNLIFWTIIGRDFLIILLSVLLSKKLGKVLPSDYVGKGTVLVICSLILAILFGLTEQNIFYKIVYNGSLILVYVSFINYVIRGIKSIK